MNTSNTLKVGDYVRENKDRIRIQARPIPDLAKEILEHFQGDPKTIMPKLPVGALSEILRHHGIEPRRKNKKSAELEVLRSENQRLRDLLSEVVPHIQSATLQARVKSYLRPIEGIANVG